MPTMTINVAPEVFLDHAGVTVYHTYERNDREQEVNEFEFTTDPGDSLLARFDVRDLVNTPSYALIDSAPRYPSSATSEEERSMLKMQWTKWIGEGKRNAIATVIKEAIDRTMIPRVPAEDPDRDRWQIKGMTLCRKIIHLDAQGQSAMDAELADALAQLISSIPHVCNLVASVRKLEHQGVLALSASGHDDVEASKRQAREAIAALKGIA